MRYVAVCINICIVQRLLHSIYLCNLTIIPPFSVVILAIAHAK
jgi:hypothetical protein